MLLAHTSCTTTEQQGKLVQTVVMNVAMVCEGCAISVKKTLKKIPGTEFYPPELKSSTHVIQPVGVSPQ